MDPANQTEGASVGFISELTLCVLLPERGENLRAHMTGIGFQPGGMCTSDFEKKTASRPLCCRQIKTTFSFILPKA